MSPILAPWILLSGSIHAAFNTPRYTASVTYEIMRINYRLVTFVGQYIVFYLPYKPHAIWGTLNNKPSELNTVGIYSKEPNNPCYRLHAYSGRDSYIYDNVIKWKYFPCYWPFVRGIHRSPVNSPHKGQWRGALMFSLICVWINN